MKKLSLTFLFTLAASTFLEESRTTGTLAPIVLPNASPTLAPDDQPDPQLGSEENPLILALAPSPHPTDSMIAAGQAMAFRLEELSGYEIVTITPASEADMVRAFSLGNVHIAVLTPFAYVQVRQGGSANVALASTRSGETLYGAQFIARSDAGFTPYFDMTRGENIAQASEALLQFNDKKPCWSDLASMSAYVVPLGYLNQAKVQTRAPAFLGGQGPVVRAIYDGGICDFGATFIDARELPTLEANYPDVPEKVEVIWRIPPIIPYENISFASSLPPDVHRVLLGAFVDLMGTEEGKAVMQTIYGIEALQAAEDNLYDEFKIYVEASGLELDALLE